jgi:hypothetical protein
MNEGGGLSVRDIAGSNHATNGPSVVFRWDTPSQFGKAVRLSTTSGDSLEAPHHPSLNVTTSMSVLAWVKTITNAYVLTKNENSFFFSIGAGGTAAKVDFSAVGVSGAAWRNGTTSVTDGNWHQIAATYDGANVCIYVDGHVDSTTASTGTISTGSSTLQFGKRSGSGTFEGGMDHVRLYNRALSSTEIALLYASPFLDVVAPKQIHAFASLGSIGAAAGSSTVTGIGGYLAESGVGASAGSSTVTGIGASTAAAVGSSSGSSTVSGFSSASFGEAAGSSTVTGVGGALSGGVGFSAGSSVAEAFSDPSSSVVDVVTFSNDVVTMVSSLAVDTVLFTDVAVEFREMLVEDHVSFTDAAVSFGAVQTAVDTVTFSDAAEPSVASTVSSTVTFSNAIAQVAETSVVDTVTMTNATEQVFTPVNLAVDTGTFTNATEVGAFSTVSDAITLTNAVDTSFDIVNLASDTITLSNATTNLNTGANTTTDTVTFTNETTSLLSAIGLAVDYLFMSDAVQGGGKAGAWTAHLETFAMTRYSGFPFQSMAVVDGVLVGTSEDGVYRMDADTDDGVSIDASITHDWMDQLAAKDGAASAPQFKHPHSLYFNGTVIGQFALALGYTDANGNELSATYLGRVRGATGYMNERIMLGRGIRSRYLQPTLYNVNGADFVINDAKIVVDLSKRSL